MSDLAAVILNCSAALASAAAARRRPAYGLLILILVDPFNFSHQIGLTTITLPKSCLIGVAIAAAMAHHRSFLVGDRRTLKLFAALLALVVLTFASFGEAQFKEPVLREGFKALEYLLMFVVAVHCYVADPDTGMVRCSLFSIGSIVSILALLEEIRGSPSATVLHGHVIPRIAGPLEGPNQLGGYLGLLLPVLVAFAIVPPRADSDERSRPPLWVQWLCIAIVSLALVLTFSRAGVFCAVVGVAVVVALTPRANAAQQRSAVWGAALAILIAIALTIAGELTRVLAWGSEPLPNGLGTRAQLWDAAWKLWLRHPWLGIGAGNFELELGQAGYPELHTHANSGYLQALVEQGIPGLLAVLWITWLSVSSFISSRVREPLVVGIAGAMAGMALHEVFDYLLFYPKVGLMFWLLFGIGAAAIAVPQPRAVNTRARAATS